MSTNRYSTAAVNFLIMSVITLLLLEMAGIYFYYQKHGGLFYMATTRAEPVTGRDKTPEHEFSTKTVLHPFLGFAFRPSLPISRVAGAERLRRLLHGHKGDPSWTALRANNHGFFSEVDYPYEKTDPRNYVIGIFGGSVAQWFALQGAERLERELGNHPALRDRDIVILNFSQGGFKQPQQVQALSYFLAIGQEFDLVVNIDGFNELALSHVNHKRNIGTSMPSAQHVLPILMLMGSIDRRQEMLDRVHSLGEFKRKLGRIEGWKSSTKSAGLFMILSVIQDRYRSDYAAGQLAIDSLGVPMDKTELVHLTTLPGDYAMATSIEDAMEVWLAAATTMQAISNARGIEYLEVIQPNQYYSNREFARREQGIAINKDSPYSEAIKLGYPQLASHIQCMRQRGINIVSAVSIFDKVKKPVYADSCCHYNQTGNDILASEVAKSITTLIEGRNIANENQTEKDGAPDCVVDRFNNSR